MKRHSNIPGPGFLKVRILFFGHRAQFRKDGWESDVWESDGWESDGGKDGVNPN
jgi:hypothetical protein